MTEASVEPYLREKTTGERAVIQSRTLRIVGIGESTVEERVRDLIAGTNPTVAPYAKTGEVHLRLTARAPSELEAAAMIGPLETQIRGRLGRPSTGRTTRRWSRGSSACCNCWANPWPLPSRAAAD